MEGFYKLIPLVMIYQNINISSKKRARISQVIDRYIHILLGDSNSVSHAEVASAVSAITGPKNTMIYFKPNRTLADNGAWHTQMELGVNNNQTADLAFYGVEANIGRKFSEDDPNKHAIIKYGLGGSELFYRDTDPNDWNPASNELYNEFKNYVVLPALADLTAANINYKISSVIISLGTNDAAVALGGEGTAFYDNCVSFCNTLKADFSLPSDCKFVLMKSPPAAPSRPYLADVRASQLLFAANYPYAFCVNGDSASLYSDATHWNNAGINTIAAAIYEIIKLNL